MGTSAYDVTSFTCESISLTPPTFSSYFSLQALFRGVIVAACVCFLNVIPFLYFFFHQSVCFCFVVKAWPYLARGSFFFHLKTKPILGAVWTWVFRNGREMLPDGQREKRVRCQADRQRGSVKVFEKFCLEATLLTGCNYILSRVTVGYLVASLCRVRCSYGLMSFRLRQAEGVIAFFFFPITTSSRVCFLGSDYLSLIWTN